MLAKKKKPSAIIRLPTPYPAQEIFFNWQDIYPNAQALIAPCGTKTGKTFGASTWMVKEALLYRSLFCAWIAPTYQKCRIAYRYMKAMLPAGLVECIDGRLEIRFPNGSFIKFLHGKDAEVTVEGEAIDRFVIDESGKIKKQVWFSLFTTITQTKGYGIITGTPRGFTWYYDLFRKAQSGKDDFFVWCQIATKDNPYNTLEMVKNAERILPKHLYDQYYLARFLTSGSVFGDLSTIWDENIVLPEGSSKFWIDPDPANRNMAVVHGMDVAKQRDYTVIYSTNSEGRMVGFCRFRHVPYPRQAQRLETYLQRYFSGDDCDNDLRYDATGVGVAFGDLLSDLDIDCSVTAVTFTNKSKSEMVTRTTMAIEQGWHRAPRIDVVEHEFSSYELKVTKSGLHAYSAPDGEQDDIVSAGILSISGAYQSAIAEEAERMLEHLNGEIDDVDIWAGTITGQDDDDFFDNDDDDDDLDLDATLED